MNVPGQRSSELRVLFLMIRRPPRSPLFPYTPLFRSPGRSRLALVRRRGALEVWYTGVVQTPPPGQSHFCTSWSRSEEHTSELQSRQYLGCRLLLEKKNSLHSTV